MTRRTTAAIVLALIVGLFAGIATGGDIMPAKATLGTASARITRIAAGPNGAGVDVTFADGNGIYSANREEMQWWAQALVTTEAAQQLLIARWVALDSDGSNPNVIVGKTLTLDLSAPNPIKVQ